MHIKATCPQCESTYQVESDLKGKRMRCPNPICRAIFVVGEPGDAGPVSSLLAPSPPAPPAVAVVTQPKRSGNVGEDVPLLPKQTGDLRSPSDDMIADFGPVSTSVSAAVSADGPTFAEWEAAPPVRQGFDNPLTLPPTNGVPANLDHDAQLPSTQETPTRRGHWGLAVLALLLMLTLGAVGAGLWLFQSTEPSDEAERLAKANKEYKDRNFGDAALLYRSLWQDFPKSEQRQEYQFHAEFSDIRDAIHRPQTDVEETQAHLDRLKKLLEIYQHDPLMANHRDDVAESLYRLVEELTGFAHELKTRNLLDLAKHLNADATKNFKTAPLAQAATINAALDAAEQQVVKAETRERIVSALNHFTVRPSLDGVEQGPKLVQQAGLANDSEVKALLDALPEHHRQSIKFSVDLDAAAAGVLDDTVPSMAVLAFRGPRPPRSAASPTRPVFALVHGVLYAFDPSAGTLLWARRVGVDTSAMPNWLPATAATPPLVLVASPEAGGVLALNSNDGSIVWCQVLPEPSTGQLLVVANRVFVACRSGAVFEIDAVSGRRLGYYDLGVELSQGGVLQPGTDIVFFAADRGCVFAINVAKRQCVGILYTDHQSGSLRCPPVVLPICRGESVDGSQANPSLGQLLLCQQDGLGKTALQCYLLPVTNSHVPALLLGDKLAGRIEQAPVCNPEHFSLLTDAGDFAVYGLRQRDNRDAEIFPMLASDSSSQFGLGSPTYENAGRPMSVHADGQNFWIAAQGRLQHFQFGMSTQDGWKIIARSMPLEPLGFPVQPAQVVADDQGRTVVYLVTETPPPSPASAGNTVSSAFLLTAVDLDSQTIRWRRQIGMVPDGLPAILDGKVVTWDRGGDLLLFDPEKSVKLADSHWQSGGKVAVRNQSGSHWLFSRADRNSATALSVSGQEAKLWQYQTGDTTPIALPFALEAPIAGTPALLGNTLVFPLANGRLAWQGAGAATAFDQWRSPQADKNALGFCVEVGPGRVICTDGNQAFTLWQLDRESFIRIKTVQTKARIIGPPAVLSDIRVCVADIGRCVTLFQGEMLGKIREWTMSDAITAGPFARAGGIIVVVGGRRLVWLDPSGDKPRWAFTFRADVVGEPALIDGALIVADESGQIQALDIETGRPRGLGYTLRAAVSPAASPLPFGPDRLFVPLADGTILLPSRAWFRSTLLGFPITR
jgi:outer membrane protein assembly factor BamB